MTHRRVWLALLVGLAGCPASTDLSAIEARLGEAETTIAAQATLISALETRLTAEEGNSTAQASTNMQVQSTFDDLASLLDGHDNRLDTAEDEITGLDDRVTVLEGNAAELRADLDTAETLVADHDALFAYVSVDSSTDSIVFSGANVYVQSGSGSTVASVNGLGNLILGYDEDDGGDTKSGSHNLVIGPYHTYTSFAAYIGGEDNSSQQAYASVFSGQSNLASGGYSAVLGGYQNESGGSRSTVLGGNGNSSSVAYQIIPTP